MINPVSGWQSLLSHRTPPKVSTSAYKLQLPSFVRTTEGAPIKSSSVKSRNTKQFGDLLRQMFWMHQAIFKRYPHFFCNL